MISKRPMLALILACGAALAGCGRNDAKSGAPSAESHAPGTTAALNAGACSAYPKGSPGVLNSFCDGPAVVKITINAKDYVLHGGSCAPSANGFALNLGVIANHDLAGPKPDYVGLWTPVATGAFANAALSVVVDGKSYLLTSNNGTLGPAGGAFEGAAVADGTKVSGSFTC